MGKFVHLHGHTEYSLLDGLGKIKTLIKHTKASGMDAIAITDHGTMYGAIEFYKTCLENEVKPIIGCELYIARRSHKDKEGKVDTEPFHLTVLAKDFEGYKNLMKLVSIAHLDGYYYRPRVDNELLKQYHQGLIALSGCPSGEFIRSLDGKDLKKSEQILKTYLEIFGEGNFFIELQAHPYEKFLEGLSEELIRQDLERMINTQKLSHQAALELSKVLSLPIVGTNDFHYISKDDAPIQDAMLCVQTGRLVADIKRLRMIDAPDFYVKSPEEMAQSFANIPQAIENSVKIAEMVNLEIPLGKPYFPIFQAPDNKSADEYLRELAYQGAKEKLGEDLSEEIKSRLEYELDIITYKNYSDYFLVFNDFFRWAHQNGIITNTRGSAAGSLVLYCLGVTNLNPLDYLLPFERFLTKSRPSLPDIDADLADDRRDEVIRYVMDKYGHDRVAHIVTFGTMMGRAAIRDIGRVLGMSYGEVDRIAKLVPPPYQGFHKALNEAIKEVPELSEIYRNDPQARKLLDMAIKTEGTVRHASVHAAGIVISPEEITHFTPLQREANGDKIVTQYDMFALTEDYGGAGLVKMDFLGIRNLSILGRAVEYVKVNQGVEVDLDELPLDDKKTYELLSRGETMGLFQLSSAGMTKNLVELRPTRIQDISAMVALYRPGPMGVIPDYIARKRNPRLISYYDPRMKEYLEQSLGLLVYQDDVLLTAINIAGYSWPDADKFRKAMGKKIPAEMAKQQEKFISGAVENGMSKEKAEGLFALIAPFAAYGFNKAHAASYAMVAYQTAYMKANFPVEFMAAVMTAEYGDIDKIAEAMAECKKMGISVLPPDVNYSGVGFSLERIKDLSDEQRQRQIVSSAHKNDAKDAIRFGLSAIKNVGVGAIEAILKVRKNGPFESLADFCTRVDTRVSNRKTLESLIKAGAMDSFGSRAGLLLILDQCLDQAHRIAKLGVSGQVSLFGEEAQIAKVEVKMPEIEELSLEQLLTFEKELLGFYLHEPPFAGLLKLVSEYTTHSLAVLGDEALVGSKIRIGGVVSDFRKVLTKKSSSEMAFVKLSDGVNTVDTVVFPTTFAVVKNFLDKDKVVLVDGKIDRREDQLSIVVENLMLFDPDSSELLSKIQKRVEINVPKSAGTEVLKEVNKTLREYPGKNPVALILPNGTELKMMDLPFRINLDPILVTRLENLLGKGTVQSRLS